MLLPVSLRPPRVRPWCRPLFPSEGSPTLRGHRPRWPPDSCRSGRIVPKRVQALVVPKNFRKPLLVFVPSTREYSNLESSVQCLARLEAHRCKQAVRVMRPLCGSEYELARCRRRVMNAGTDVRHQHERLNTGANSSAPLLMMGASVQFRIARNPSPFAPIMRAARVGLSLVCAVIRDATPPLRSGCLACCQFCGHRDKVFMKLEDLHDEKSFQPRVQAGSGGIGNEAWRECGAGFKGSGDTCDCATPLGAGSSR